MKVSLISLLLCLSLFEVKAQTDYYATYISSDKSKPCQYTEAKGLHNCPDRFFDAPVLYEIDKAEKVIFKKSRNNTTSYYVDLKTVVTKDITSYSFTNDKGEKGMLTIDYKEKMMYDASTVWEPILMNVMVIKHTWRK